MSMSAALPLRASLINDSLPRLPLRESLQGISPGWANIFIEIPILRVFETAAGLQLTMAQSLPWSKFLLASNQTLFLALQMELDSSMTSLTDPPFSWNIRQAIYWSKTFWQCLTFENVDIQLRTSMKDNHNDLTIKSDSGQHSQFLRCFSAYY